MTSTPVDPSTLTTFGDVAAGHEGVLSDPSGSMVIKPCTSTEVAFYEAAVASYPALAAYMPTYMGVLELADPAKLQQQHSTAETPTPGSSTPVPVPSTAATLSPDDPGPLHGRALTTSTAIVLSNAAAGFTRPNILDIKLGARLWDDDAPPEKRARLDKVAATTTSASLGFRVAGMRVYSGTNPPPAPPSSSPAEPQQALQTFDPTTGYTIYNKFYGRQFAHADDVRDAFLAYLLVPHAGIDRAKALQAARVFRAEVRDVQRVLESLESRMYSASLLFVYEGDANAFAATAARVAEWDRRQESEEGGTGGDGTKGQGDEGSDDDEEEVEPPKIAAVTMIDFAHARFTPGQGPDENALQGVRSLAKILDGLVRRWEKEEKEERGE